MSTTDLLDTMLNEESADISLYTKEAELFADKIVAGEKIAETFNRFAAEEAHHLAAITTISGRARRSRQRKIETGNSLRRTLDIHREREEYSIKIYTELLDAASDPLHRLLLKGIIAQETEHLAAIERYLKNIRDK